MANGTTPLKATFFALRKRDSAVLLPATIVFAIVVALLVAAFLALNWRTISGFNEFAQMAAAQESGTADPDVAASFVFGMFGLFGSALLFMFPLYIAFAAYESRVPALDDPRRGAGPVRSHAE